MMGTWTQKSRNPWGKTRPFCYLNPTQTHKLIPEENLKTNIQNPKTKVFFQVLQFSPNPPLFTPEGLIQTQNFLSKITLELFCFSEKKYFSSQAEWLFFQKYFHFFEVWKILEHKNEIKIPSTLRSLNKQPSISNIDNFD